MTPEAEEQPPGGANSSDADEARTARRAFLKRAGAAAFIAPAAVVAMSEPVAAATCVPCVPGTSYWVNLQETNAGTALVDIPATSPEYFNTLCYQNFIGGGGTPPQPCNSNSVNLGWTINPDSDNTVRTTGTDCELPPAGVANVGHYNCVQVNSTVSFELSNPVDCDCYINQIIGSIHNAVITGQCPFELCQTAGPDPVNDALLITAGSLPSTSVTVGPNRTDWANKDGCIVPPASGEERWLHWGQYSPDINDKFETNIILEIRCD